MLKKLWTIFWQPSARFSLGSILIVGGIGGIIFWGGFNTFMEYSNSLEFCISCHEMRSTVYEEYKHTSHYSNASGVRAICSDCHVPKDWTRKLIRKIQATNEVFHWMMGTINTPEKFEAHRLEMAERVWASMKASDSRECRNCHDYASMNFAKQHKNAQTVMKKALKEGRTCIECHRGIAHKQPDLMLSFKGSLAGQSVSSGRDIAVGPRAMAIAAAVDGPEMGQLMPGAPLKVLQDDGERLQVEVKGWAPVAYRLIITSALGQRLSFVKLNETGKGARQVLRSAKDLYDETWEQVSLTGWVAKAGLAESTGPVWAFADKIYQHHCDSCHVAHSADEYSANQWPGELDSMADYGGLMGAQLVLVRQYLQTHARILLVHDPEARKRGADKTPAAAGDVNEAEDD